MSRPLGMFVILVRDPHARDRWTCFLPAPDGAPNIVQMVRVPGLNLPAVEQQTNTGGAIAILIGAAAGIAGVPVDEFIRSLHLTDAQIREARGIPKV